MPCRGIEFIWFFPNASLFRLYHGSSGYSPSLLPLLFHPSSFPCTHSPPPVPTPTTCLAEFPHHPPSNPRIIQCRLRWSAKGEMLPGMCSPPHSHSPDTAEAEYNICCSCANQFDHFFRIDHNTFSYKRSTRTPPELTILTIVFPFILHPIAGPTLRNRWVSYAS